jgi:hypothetical protein
MHMLKARAIILRHAWWYSSILLTVVYDLLYRMLFTHRPLFLSTES